MEENNNATDTNVGSIKNSIEENIELLQEETSSLGLFFKCKGSEKYKIALEHILSDYKRVLKENEELVELKVSASAHNRILELKQENEQLNTEVNSLKEDNERYQELELQILESEE